ncbi:hypothetical protein CRM22_004595 [Opisthorchis felineus]|uniref:MAM domain-containing protein n=1 Tax=Opisthorchis felineus TaxID=147828 RepID=A0A4S2LVD7_OPIFE|nr:hypothetical protein CRM22_004595 [Opisthorchis felineus]
MIPGTLLTSACKAVQHGSENKFTVACENERLWQSSLPGVDRNTLTGQWQMAMVQIASNGTTSDYKLILEGTIPAGYPDARICVDNITSYTEPCSALQKTAAVVSNHWSWAQYFGITFVTALILGLTIPILFLVILIWACRRRHHNMNSPYTDNKLFSTNLWYYIGGKEIHDDPTGFRGASSLIRSNKHFHTSSGAGTLRNNTQVVPDVMDLPDVVIPGGRVVSFNYSGNTLGPGGTLRHMSQTSSQLMQPTNCFNTGLTMGTVSSQSSGTPATTVGRSGPDGVLQPDPNFNFQQQQQQNQQQNNGLLGVPGQLPMLMTQSVSPNYRGESNAGQFHDTVNAVGSTGQYNTYAPSMVTTSQPQYQQEQQSIIQPQVTVGAFQQQPVQQHQVQSYPAPVGQPQQPQPVVSQQQQAPLQQPVLPQQPQHPIHQQLPQQVQTTGVQFAQPTANQAPQQQQLSQRRSIIQPFQLPPPQQQQQTQQHQSFAAQLPNQPVSVHPQVQSQQPRASVPPPPPPQQQQQQQQQHQPPIQQNIYHMATGSPNAQFNAVATQPVNTAPNTQPIAAVTPTTRVPATPVSSLQSDSLTDADQQAAMAALFAATEEAGLAGESNFIGNGMPARDVNDTYMDAAHPSIREDHPPPGYDEAIGLILPRPAQNGGNNHHVSNNAHNMFISQNTMAKPALPVPSTACTPPPALPPRRVVNGMGLEDIEDPQPGTCLSLAERYGLPVAEI